MTHFYSPREALDALQDAFSIPSYGSLVSTLIDVHPDYGTHTDTAYSGYAIVKRLAGGGLQLYFWRVNCTPDDDGPSANVYYTGGLSEDTEEAFRTLVRCIKTSTDDREWAFPQPRWHPTGGYSSAPLNRLLMHRYPSD